MALFQQDYTYDDTGNLTDRNGLALTYNPGERPHLPGADSEGTSYDYDENGNMVSRTLSSGTVISYTYDAENRLTQVISNTGLITTSTDFIYDGGGQLVVRAQSDGTKTYHLGEYIEYPVGDSAGGSGGGASLGEVTLVHDSNVGTAEAAMAVDTEAESYFVWVEDGDVFFQKGLTGTPSNVSNTPDFVSVPAVAVTPDGVIHVVWQQTESSGRNTIYYARSTDGGATWVDLREFYIMVTEQFWQEKSKGWEPQIVAAANGTVHVVWRGTTNDPTGTNPTTIYHAYDANGVWSDIAGAGGGGSGGFPKVWMPDIAAGSNGDLHMVWISRDYLSAAGDKVYYHRWDSVSESWDAAQLVSFDTIPDTVNPSVAVAQDGAIHAVWQEPGTTVTGTLRHNYKGDAETWPISGNISQVSGAGTAAPQADIAVADDGTTYIVWLENDELVYAERPQDGVWSDPVPIPGVSAPNLTTGRALAYGPGLGVHLAFQANGADGNQDVYYVEIVPPANAEVLGTPTKRYYAGGQQVATRVDDETLFYHVNDPTGTSLALVDGNGDADGRILYDSFGMALTNTLPLTLTGTLLDMPDAATGLVHLGDGRWYDPGLGRPLQPNSMGGPPTLPQALNRYAATSLGQPGVAQAAVSSGISPIVQSIVNQVPGLVAGGVATALSNNLASTVVTRIGFTGYGLVQAEGAARQIAALVGEWNVTSTRLADGLLRKPLSFFFSRFRIQTAQRRMFVGRNLQYLDEYAEGLGLNGVQVSLVEREIGNVVDDAATRGAQQLAARLGSKAFQTLLGGTASALVQYTRDYNNPYLTTGDKVFRSGVSFSFGAGAALIGAYIGGPIGAGAGFVVGTILDYTAAPFVFEATGRVPERNLSPLTP